MVEYVIREGFTPEVVEEFDTLEEAMGRFDEMGEYAGCKSAWFGEANCMPGKSVPDDYRVSVSAVTWDDGEIIEEEVVAEKKYGYDEMIAEYGSMDDAPFGMKLAKMTKLGW